MSQLIENYDPLIYPAGFNTNKNATFGGTVAVTGEFTPTGGIAAAGSFTQSPRTVSTGGRGATALTTGTDTAFTTTDTYIAEVFIPANMTITGVSVLQGTTTGNGHLSVALANSSGVVVASSATTTTTGTATTYTQVAFSSTYAAKGPATYYVLVQGDSTSDHIRMHAAGNFGASLKTSETYGTFTTVTAPTTFTAAQGPIADLY